MYVYLLVDKGFDEGRKLSEHAVKVFSMYLMNDIIF